MACNLNCKQSKSGRCKSSTNGTRLHQHNVSTKVTVIRPEQPMCYPVRANEFADVLDLAASRSIYFPVHVSIVLELSSDHCLILANVAIQHPTDTVQQVNKVLALFDMVDISAMEVSPWMKHVFVLNYQRIAYLR